MKGYVRIAGAFLAWCQAAAWGAPPAAPSIDVAVLEPRNQAIAGALVQLRAGSAMVSQAETEPRPQRWYQFFKELPKDPWGNPYIYRCPGLKNPGGYDLYSAGQDRQADTADDDWGGG